jgi:hypothetical protein
MSSIPRQMHNLTSRVYASSFCETYSQSPASSGFFRSPASMGKAILTGPVVDSKSSPLAGPDANIDIFFGLTAGFSRASIHARQELQGGSPISDSTLAALQGASISFGMPGMQPVSFHLTTGLSRSTFIDACFALFGQWITLWTAGRIPVTPANGGGHWMKTELPQFMRAAAVTGEWHHVRLTGLRQVGGGNWAAVFLILV